MPPKSAILAKAAKAKAEEAKTLLAKIEAENRQPTEDESKQHAGLLAESKSLLAQSRQHRDAEALDDEFADAPPPKSDAGPARNEDATTKVHAEARDREAEARGGFRHFGEMAKSVYDAGMGTRMDNRLGRLYSTVGSDEMSAGNGPRGGFLLPPAFSTQVWDGVMAAPDNLLPMTDSYALGSEESITFPAVDESSQTIGVAAGMTATWRSEFGQMSGSRPKLREVRLEPHEMYVFAYVTEKLLNNSPLALGQFLTAKAGLAISSKTSDAIYAGDGAGKPQGILESSALIQVTKEPGQAADTIVAENIVKMYARMLPAAIGGAYWFYNQEAMVQLLQLTMGIGAAGVPVFMPAGGFSQAPFATIFGRPAIPLASAKKLGDKGDIVFVNPKFYATATRGGIRSAESMHIRFDYAQMAFRFQFEVDGRSWLPSAITPANATSGVTLSPFVALAERA